MEQMTLKVKVLFQTEGLLSSLQCFWKKEVMVSQEQVHLWVEMAIYPLYLLVVIKIYTSEKTWLQVRPELKDRS